MNRSIEILDKKRCCGCSACSSICPKQAISMRFSREGFLEPAVNRQLCVNCGVCVNACPSLNTEYENETEPACYAVMAEDSIRQVSSSGGMFTLIAEYFLERKGYLCGAVLNEDFGVEHVITSDKAGVKRMRRSKYAQSNLKDCYRQIQKLLQKGETVAFTGCPCQVAGLYRFLGGHAFPNLFTIDLVCHGVPPVKMFQKYLSESYGIENVQDFHFRTKEFGYNSFHQTAYLKGDKKVSTNIKFDAYEKAMHSGLMLKEICGDCPFAETPRQGDLTIGDFWGVSKINPAFNDGKGTSIVLVNNNKGRQLFDALKTQFQKFEKMPLEEGKKSNRFKRKMAIPKGRDWFFHMVQKQSFEKAVDYSLNRKFDIGVIGLWYGRNYGSMATYYALHYVLKSLGLSVLMIENCLKPDGEIERTKTHPRKIADRYYDVSKKYSLDELRKLNRHCDAFIVGSDQLWNIGLSRPYKQTYFLGFAGEESKKIAYGTSFGKEYGGTEEEKLLSGYHLRRFDHVSVRDTLSQNICRDIFGVKATEVCDPTFLCPMEGYEELISHTALKEEGEYLLAYILDPSEEIGVFLKRLAEEKGKKVVVLLDEPPWQWEDNVKRLHIGDYKNIEIKREVDLYEWMWYYKHASAVFTDSFHGTIFSIIFQKPFLTLSNAKRGAQRFVSLLEPLQLKERLLQAVSECYQRLEMLESLDYTQANLKLREIQLKSYEWLKTAIFSPKEVKSKTVYPIHYQST